MFENIINFFKKLGKKDGGSQSKENSKDAAKERLHLVLMQDRANVSADFLELMKQEIIDVIKKYIEVDEKEIDVRLTNKENEDGTNGAPALYANIPILNIKHESKKTVEKQQEDSKKENNQENKIGDKVENKVEAQEENTIENKQEEKEVENNKVESEIVKESEEEKQKEIETQEKIQEMVEEVIEKQQDTEKQEEKTSQN